MSNIMLLSGIRWAHSIFAVALAVAAPLALACQSADPAANAAAASAPAAAAERPATADEIRAVAVGRTMSGGMTYNADGSYLYRGADPGRYEITDGRVCVKFDRGGSRCDRIVTNGTRYTLITTDRRRVPFG